jgi:hypothetical protein
MKKNSLSVCVRAKKTSTTKGRKNIGEQGSKVKKTSMTEGRKTIGEQGSKVEKQSAQQYTASSSN